MTLKAVWIVLLGCSLASAALLRSHLLRARRDLGLEPLVEAKSVSADAERASTTIVLTCAATGVFRALAIDYFWIRAVRLQQAGQFFESTTLSEIITSLEPRLPVVWVFHANNLAYNITAALPPRARYPWILEAVHLLRDKAPLYNPRDPTILLNLAFVFQHKIGLDFDDAGYLYRSELSRTFDVERGSPAWRKLLEEWRIDPVELQRVENKWAVRLDFRAAESHALYWAEIGLDAPGTGTDAFARRGLFHVVRGSILQLFTGGHAVRAPVGRLYAFIPDLQVTEAVRRILELTMERYRNSPTASALAEDAYLQCQGKLVYFLFLYGREVEARARFVEARDRLAPSATSLEDFLLTHIGFLTEERSPAGSEGPGDATGAGARAGKPDLGAMAACLDSALYLELAGEEKLAGGFRSLARLLHGRLPAGARRPFDDYVRAATRRRVALWMEAPRLRSWVPESLKSVLSAGGPFAEDLGLRERGELPFRLELLDPLRAMAEESPEDR